MTSLDEKVHGEFADGLAVLLDNLPEKADHGHKNGQCAKYISVRTDMSFQ